MRSFVPDYELVSPRTLENALEMLAAGETWRPIAGGTDLMVLFNAGKLPYRKLVSVRHIPELRQISTMEKEIYIGAAVSYTEIRNHGLLAHEFPLLGTAASWTGGIANQNRGTLGGNIVNASPAADSCPPLLVYDAELELRSHAGARRVKYSDFHKGYKAIDLCPDELLVSILLPRRFAAWKQYSRKVGARRAQAISKISFAAVAHIDGGVVRGIRVAAGSVAPVPLLCSRTQAALEGKILSSQAIEMARETIATEIQPITDIRSTREYRRVVTTNLLTEFLNSLA